MNTNNITKSPTAMSEKPLHRGRGWGGSPTAMSVKPPHRGGGLEGVSPQPIKNRESFFGFLKFGLQRYFDRYDNTYSGVISLTVGVRDGRVLGIAKNEGLFDYEKGGKA